MDPYSLRLASIGFDTDSEPVTSHGTPPTFISSKSDIILPAFLGLAKTPGSDPIRIVRPWSNLFRVQRQRRPLKVFVGHRRIAAFDADEDVEKHQQKQVS